MDKRLVARNFSRYAHLYDDYADIQKKTTGRLLDCIKGSDFKSILELGCGTGNFTLSLRDEFRNTQIKALDISRKMVEIAENKLRGCNVEFIISDAEEIACPEKFDLIISHACFQWFTDLEKALERYQGLLKENGRIVFSAFGPLTFQELNVTLRSVLKSSSIQADFFLNKEDLESALGKYFKETQIQETTYEEFFPSLMDLLNNIKYSGTGGSGMKPRFLLGRRLLKKIEKVYLNRFSSIKTTYQIFFCQGRAI